jgi:hypothetical protein
MLHKTLSLALLGLLVGCSALPQTFPADAPRRNLVPVDTSQVVVKEEFEFAPSLTGMVLPADVYIPVRRDKNETYYESPRGILIVPAVGAPYLVRGGILRDNDPSKKYPLSIYGAPLTWPLDSGFGARVKGKIECTPACEMN